MALPAPRLQTPGPQNCEKINLCSWKPPSLWSFVTAAPRPQPWEKKTNKTRKHFPALPLHGNHHQHTSFWEIFTYIVHQGNSVSAGIVLPTGTGPQGLHRERGSAGQSLFSPAHPQPQPSHWADSYRRHWWVVAHAMLLLNQFKRKYNHPIHMAQNRRTEHNGRCFKSRLGEFLKEPKHEISPVDTGQGQMPQDQSSRRLTAESCISLHVSFPLCFLNYRFALMWKEPGTHQIEVEAKKL